MKKILASLLAIQFLFVTPCRADKLDPVSSFKEFIATAEQKSNVDKPVYYNDYHHKWAKRNFELHNVEYDVKENDSLAFPAVGSVKFDLYYSQSKLVKKKQDAMQARKFETKGGEGIAHNIINIAYKFDGKRWTLSKADVVSDPPYPDVNDVSYSLTREDITKRSDGMPHALLLYWMGDN